MNTVSFETAIALRDAGFPQPEFAIRQTWYAYLYPEIWPDGTEFYIANTDAMRFITISEDRLATTGVQDSSRQGEIYGGSVVFAPQAHDILRELGGEYHLSIDSTPKGESFIHEERQVFFDDGLAGVVVTQFGEPHANPHEVAAKAYLKTKKDGNAKP